MYKYLETIGLPTFCCQVPQKFFRDLKAFSQIKIQFHFFFCSKHGLVVSGQNKMYMAGGEYPDGSASQAFWRYDPVLDVWQEMASMQSPRSELGN